MHRQTSAGRVAFVVKKSKNTLTMDDLDLFVLGKDALLYIRIIQKVIPNFLGQKQHLCLSIRIT